MNDRPETLAEAVRRYRDAPDGTLVPAAEVAADLEALEPVAADVEPRSDADTVPPEPPRWTWKERLWAAPSECRLGVTELAEALGRSPSWIYARTQADADPRLPHGKLSGSLTFRAGEIRAWLRDQEEDVVGYRMESAPGELRVSGRRTA